MVQQKKLTEQIEEIKELLKKNQQLPGEKNFKGKRMSKSKLKKGNVLVILMKENNYFDLRVLPVINGNVYLKEEGTYHLADAEYIGYWKNKPVLLLPTWSNEPITKDVLTRKIDENRSTIKPQKQIIHLMEDARLAEQTKTKSGMKAIIIILIIVAIIYILGRGQGWF